MTYTTIFWGEGGSVLVSLKYYSSTIDHQKSSEKETALTGTFCPSFEKPPMLICRWFSRVWGWGLFNELTRRLTGGIKSSYSKENSKKENLLLES